MRATKCVTQRFDSGSLGAVLHDCLTLTYNAIRYGEENGITNRKGMKGFYRSLKGVELPSCYKVAVISRACAVLESRKKSKKRGFEVPHPKPLRPVVCLISGFFITMKGRLFIPLASRNEYADVVLNHHAQEVLAGKKLRSLTITPNILSICYSEEVVDLPIRTVYGVDRNEKNLTFGDREGVVQIDMKEAVRIRQTTREIVGSFRRNDARVRRRLSRKYWKRCGDRTNHLLHAATNFIVEAAARNNAALALEELRDIRNMYRRGNGEGEDYRFRLNSWPFWKAEQMLEYKAAWKGLTVIPLTRSETYGSSTECASCGERTHQPDKGDAEHRRMLWCQKCKAWTDRDANAALNLSNRGLARFASSLPLTQSAGRSQQPRLADEGEKGLAVEAVKGNPTQTVILRVDASKLARGPAVNTPSHGPTS